MSADIIDFQKARQKRSLSEEAREFRGARKARSSQTKAQSGESIASPNRSDQLRETEHEFSAGRRGLLLDDGTQVREFRQIGPVYLLSRAWNSLTPEQQEKQLADMRADYGDVEFVMLGGS